MFHPSAVLDPTKLRQQAERIVCEQAAAMAENQHEPSPAEMRQMLHELRIRQIELELEKEERSQTHTSLINTLLDSIPDLVFVKDIEGFYQGCNPAFAALLGCPREAIVGKTDYDLFPADEATQFRSADWRALESGEINRRQESITYPDGHEVLVDTLKTAYRGPDGQLLGVLGVSRDITAIKRIEDELARVSTIQCELMHLATSFVNIPMEQQDGAIQQSLATMGRLIAADRAYLFEYDIEAATTSNTHEWCAEGITPEIDNLQNIPFEAVTDWLEAHFRGELITIPRVAALPAASRVRQILESQGIRSVLSLPLMDNGVCLGFVGFDAVREERIWQAEEIALLRVLAELYASFRARVAAEQATRTLQQRLIAARDEAQAAAAAKSLFLANMSHEIRTPLNAILGYAQIMEYDGMSATNGEHLKAITRSGEHLLTLINDLLELVRGDARAVRMAPVDFDLHQMLEDVRLMFAHRPGAHGLTMEITLAAAVPQFIHADPGKIRQVLVNLVGNAFKFTQQGWIRIGVSATPGDQPSSLLLAVEIEDTGCGIGADELEAIFEAFEQSASGRESGKGTGLGLHLSRRYARAHGGDITVTSQPGRGSCFRATFQARATSGHGLAEAAGRQVRRLAPGQPPCHILVVDDDATNSDMLTKMLNGVGFTVEVAGSAQAALRRLGRDARVNLVLMDKRMPEMDGYEAIKRIRELPAGRALPVVVVTATGFAEERDLALAAGANGYVAKPVRSGELLAEIRRACGGCYEYESIPAATADPAGLALPAQALADVPVDLRDALEAALNRGDIRSLRRTLDEIALTHPALASDMRMLAEAYDYERLHGLLATAQNQPPTATE